MQIRKNVSLFIFALLIMILSFSGASGKEYLLTELPYLNGSIISIADLFNNDRQQIISGQGSEVRIYEQDQLIDTISGFNGNVTALTHGDISGDFRPEILIGTDTGCFYVYQRIDGKWYQVVERRYLWTPVVHLEVGDITGNGWGDVIVRTQRGEAFIYISWSGELDLFWRSQTGENVKFITLSPLTGQDKDDVVFAHNSGYVGVLGWQEDQLDLLWQNYPWGTIDSLMTVKLQSNSKPEIVVITGQNIFYSWQWNGSTIETRRHFDHEFDGHNLLYIQDLGLINIADESGITIYNITTSSLQKKSQIPLYSVNNLWQVNDEMIVRERTGRYYYVTEINSADLEVYFNAKPLKRPLELKIFDGRIYAAIDALASNLSFYRFGTKQIYLVKGLDYVVIDPLEGSIRHKQMTLPVTIKILDDANQLFVPLSILPALGYEVEYDLRTSTLQINRNWGWW